MERFRKQDKESVIHKKSDDVKFGERDLELLCTRSYGLTVVSQLESDLKFRFDISNVANVKTSFKSLNSPFSHKIFIKSI